MFRFILVFLLCLTVFAPAVSLAYSVTKHNESTPYEVLKIDNVDDGKHYIIGELDGYPEMIEFTTDEPLSLRTQILALPSSTTPNFGGIIVRVLTPRGVEEIVRMKSSEATWEVVKEPVSKLSFLSGPSFETKVASGTYRVEVSTPENFGKYIILLGNTDTNGDFGATWRAVSDMYEFAEVSKIAMLRTPLVYYPVGIILLLFGFGYTIWRTRDRLPFIKHYA